jgi:catechol 2,3-dioxygenase-like lactoylglutathione lyase family enzyme
VSDFDRAQDFWSGTVGLDVVGGGGPFRFLDGGGLQLALNEVDGWSGDDSLTEIVFEVDDIVESHAAMAASGVPFEVEPRAVMSEGGRELWATHFRDPDGHLASVTGWVSR